MMSNCAFRVALCACAMCTFASVQILYSAEYIRVASPSVRIGEPWPCVIAIGYHENINKQSDWRMCERGSSSIGAAIVAPSAGPPNACTIVLCVCVSTRPSHRTMLECYCTVASPDACGNYKKALQANHPRHGQYANNACHHRLHDLPHGRNIQEKKNNWRSVRRGESHFASIFFFLTSNVCSLCTSNSCFVGPRVSRRQLVSVHPK